MKLVTAWGSGRSCGTCATRARAGDGQSTKTVTGKSEWFLFTFPSIFHIGFTYMPDIDLPKISEMGLRSFDQVKKA